MRRVFLSFLSMSMIPMGCVAAWGQSKPDTNQQSPAEKPLPAVPDGSASKPMEGSVAPVDPNKYVLGAEDVIFIRTWREPDFTQIAVVRPDGKISMPLLGDIQAGGITPQTLADDIKTLLTKYINNPDVTVFVQDVRSKKYYLDGEMNRTGPFPLATPITVLEALSYGGGFREFANQKDIRILRDGKIIHFNYKQVINGKHLDQNIYVENGDHIIVH